MKLQFHKPLFLFKLLGLSLLFLLFHRIIFLVVFHSQFQEIPTTEFIKAFIIGTLTDTVASVYFLLPTWLVLLFFNIEHKITKYIALIWFTIGFNLICILNFTDLGYYPITNKRMGAELLEMLPEIPSLLNAYLIDYWYLVILVVIFFLIAFSIFKNQLYYYKNKTQTTSLKAINIIIIVLSFTLLARGSIGERAFEPIDIPSLVDSKLQWLASNTPFQFIHTLGNKPIKIENYFNELEAEKIIEFKKQFHSQGFQKKNILFIILESFSSERVGLFNPAVKAYTPFMDSLFSNARTYKYGMANGRMTIDALPSVLTGIPSFMDKNYCYSNYSNNDVHAISYLLQQEGYHTAFFYGGLKTTFGFESFTKINFTKQYYDQKDYDKPYDNIGWGVDDHLYLKFIGDKLNHLQQPFCASLLTLSLHHPFPIPKSYKKILDTINDPMKKSLRYTDIALQLFFNQIKHQNWYQNSIIAICADHTSTGIGNFECNPVNEFAIPIAFFTPGDTAFNKIQNQSISQIDMYPTVLDYLGYNNPFISLGNSALKKTHPTIQYGGNGLYHIFDYPYMLDFDNNKQAFTKRLFFNENRTVTPLIINKDNQQKIEQLEKQMKAYLQVFSYRINKNQF